MKKPWAKRREKQLLEFRISELGLTLEDSALFPLVERLYNELAANGLAFKPPCFLASEWFCPVGIPAIGIPFYLAHNRLRQLERKYILDIEGGTKTDFMKLIRHEAGHAYSYAYFLYKKKKWQKLFGLASDEYPDLYRPRPYSKSYVLHLDNWYAQSHPDEDFAESFAVWLTPGLNWRKKYRGWKALEKLEYIDSLMKSIAEKPALHNPSFKPREHAELNIKLKTYFQRKKKAYEESYPDFYDNDLNTLFTANPEEKGEVKASRYLKVCLPHILKSAPYWTKEKKYTIDQLMRKLIERTDNLGLYVRKNSFGLDFQITSFITTLVMTYLFTGTFKRTK